MATARRQAQFDEPASTIEAFPVLLQDGAQPPKVSWQDALDGAALRRLREALPEGVRHATIDYDPDPDAAYAGPWSVTVYGPDTTCNCCHMARGRVREGYGDTITEAADKCREALEGGGS